MPWVRPHLLGRHPLAAHARGVRGAVRDVLRRLKAGELTEDEALHELRSIQREGLVSRASYEHMSAVHAAAQEAGMKVIPYSNSARVLREGFSPEVIEGKIGILTAGTSDVVVADEARMVAEACGVEVRMEADLGVAGLHRFVAPLSAILDWGADVLVVAAGMDGVLPGLVAGLVALPVIGLPVSSGYGRGGAGEAALLTMLQSCSTGLTVVNIDNGVGAGTAAVMMAARVAHKGQASARKARG